MQTSLIAQNNKGASALFILNICIKRFQKYLTIHLKMIIMSVDVYTIKTEERIK